MSRRPLERLPQSEGIVEKRERCASIWIVEADEDVRLPEPRPRRSSRASVWGERPICSRTYAIRCLGRQSTALTIPPMLARPPVATRRDHAHRLVADHL